MNRIGLTFVVLSTVYSLVWLVWLAAGRFMESEGPVSMRYHSMPIETTTAEERARGESSFEIARRRQWGITRTGFFILVIVGYVALGVAFGVALIVMAH